MTEFANVPFFAKTCLLDRSHDQSIVAAGEWDEYGDPAVGEWSWIDDWVRSLGLDPGPPYLAQTYGGGHSSTSLHYIGRGARARDYGARGVDHVAIAEAAVPLAISSEENQERYGHPYPVQELFCEEVGIRYSGGSASSFRDNPDHTHIGKVLGVRLVLADQSPSEEDELMAAKDEIITRVDQHLDALNQEQKDFIVEIMLKVQGHIDEHLDAIYEDIDGRLKALEGK